MGAQTTSAVVAIAVGLGIALVLFVPFVWLSFRRQGRLTLTRMLFFIAALIYFMALWTFTLLPLPHPDDIVCAPVELNPLSVVTEIQKGLAAANPLTSPAILQLAFNVLLFVPLGIIIRVVLNKGWVVALLVGLGVSLFIELTQYTGVWGIYPCAYRIADVGDLMTNTTGAVVGSLLGMVVPHERRGIERQADADAPRPVTRTRRALAMLCDGLGYWFVSGFLATAGNIALTFLWPKDAEPFDGRITGLAANIIALTLWLVVILATGQSIGDLAVQLRYTGGTMPTVIKRPLRWLGGIGGVALFSIWGDDQLTSLIAAVLFLIAIVLFFTTKLGRGLPGVLTGQRLSDARGEVAAASAPAPPE